jgi:hypothetical protein
VVSGALGEGRRDATRGRNIASAARAPVRGKKGAVRDARARDRASRQVSLRTPEPREVLSRTSERTGRRRCGTRATRGAMESETRDPR